MVQFAQCDWSNRQKMNDCSFSHFYGKTWVDFCLNTGKCLCLSKVVLKNGTRNYQNGPLFKRLACFIWQSLESFGHFWYFNFFKKLEHRFSLESIKIRNATFPYKTALSELSVKTNRMEHTKWTCHKEWPFLDFCFSIRTSYKELNWWVNFPNVHIHTFRKRSSFIWGYFFPASIFQCYYNFIKFFCFYKYVIWN